MDPFWLSTLLTVAVILGSIVYVLRARSQGTRKLPPGPGGLELMREVCGILRKGRMAEVGARLAKKYGDIVRVDWLRFGVPTVFFSNPADVREFFTGKGTRRVANSREPSRISTMQKPSVTFDSPEDGQWVLERKMFHQALQFYGLGYERVEKTMRAELQTLMTQLRNKAGQDMEIKPFFFNSVLRIIHILLTGEKIEEESPEHKCMEDYMANLEQLFDLERKVETFPFLLYIPGSVKAVYDAYQYNFKKMTQHFYNDMAATHTSGSIRGLVDFWIDKMEGEHSSWMTEKHIHGLINPSFSAGILTTMETLTSMFLFLLNHPQVVTKIQEEVDRVVGPDHSPTLEHRDQCHYSQATLLEIMRIVPLVPLSLPHRVIENTEFKGYFFPKGTVVLANEWAFHRSEALWKSALEFQPERFLDEEGQLLPATHPLRMQMLPFGVGMRSCPGETFARARLFLYLTTILHNFDPLPPSAGDLPSLTPGLESWQMGVVMHVNGYSCRFAERQKKC